MKIKFYLLLFLFLSILTKAQSPVSGFMKQKGQTSAVLSYAAESYDSVYFVPSISDAVPIFRDVKISSQSLYLEYGVTNNFNVVVNLPYITATGNATESSLKDLGFENKRTGLQDLKIYTKYNFGSFVKNNYQIDFIGVFGLELPMGYNADEGLQSIIAIGDEARKLNFSGIMMYKNKNGFFGSGQIGNTFKNNRVPNALTSEWKIGYAAKRFYVDTFFATQLNSSVGVDILQPGFEGFFPATKVNFTRIGLNAYVPFAKNFGLTAGANKYLSGRNLGIATGFYGGLVFNF